MLAPRFIRLCPAAVVVLAASLAATIAPTASAEQETPLPTVKLTKTRLVRGDASMGWWRDQQPSLTPTASVASLARIGDSGVNGIDVSRWQRTVNWDAWRSRGKTFAYVKATEGTSYRNPYFKSQYDGSRASGMIRGAYHFGSPGNSSGRAQADYFVKHGGGWTRDGKTLPGVLDIEYNPYGRVCYGMSKRALVGFVKSFTRRYKARTGRDAVIYTTYGWWKRCTGNSKAFNHTNPIWVARYQSTVGTLPGAWPYYTFWQYSSSPLDQDHFSASRRRLIALAKG